MFQLKFTGVFFDSKLGDTATLGAWILVKFYMQNLSNLHQGDMEAAANNFAIQIKVT